MGNIKIPKFLGIFLVLLMVAGLFVTTQGVDKISNLFSQADENIPAQGVTVANVTDTSFTVYWTTAQPAEGTVFYGTTESLEDGAAVDDRALGQTGQKYQTHLVKVTGLSPNTNYFFKVGQVRPSSQTFEAKTGPAITASTTLEPVVGKALSASGQPLSGAIATWQAPGATKVASLTKSDGSYSLPLSQARTTDLTASYEPPSGSPEKIIILSGTGEGTINCEAGEDSTMPDIKIGQTIDCNEATVATDTEENSVGTDNISNDKDTQVQGGFGSLVKTPTNNSQSGDSVELNIQSGETVSTGLPTFSGKVGPRQVVKIVVHSDEVFSATVIAKPDGSWSWTPPSNLSPGEHTVTMTIVNAGGTTETVNRTFFVSSGQPILPITNGTPSATLTLTPTPIVTSEPVEDELLESGIEDGTILALTMGVLFTILGIGAVFVLN